jgi:excisionase family DNA binding protein
MSSTNTSMLSHLMSPPDLIIPRNQPDGIDVLKILHYSASVYPELAKLMPTKTTKSEILTIKQVADYLKVTERTIYRLAAAKRIPAFKVGGTWRFSCADIDIWIKRQSMERLDTGRDVDDPADGQTNDGERK